MSVKSMAAVLFLLYSFLEPVFVMAQPKCSIGHYSTLNGLSDNRVMYLMKDSEGFMWMGTWTGINRFDGHNFVTYKSHPGDQSELKNNRIDLIVEGGGGCLWLKAYDQQVYRFDKKTEQFLSVSTFLQPGKRSKTEISNIIALKNGQVVLTTRGQGLFLVSEAASDKPSAVWFSESAGAASRLPSDSVNCFYEDSASDAWIGSTQGLTRLHTGTGGSYKKALVADRLQNANITCIAESAASLWFGTADGKLLALNKRTGKLVALTVSTGRVNDLHVSNNRRDLYLSTSHGEVITVSIDSLQVSATGIFAGNELRSIYEDRAGRLWLEPKENGVVLFDPKTKAFRLFTQP
ncbi:MAG TPA: two-component regulator propeller domain-containing protein, partial [Chitinophagaceae bacterium]|nr:two-component regulator propeller domain-containing protein [Chitinophagaceae bacterium]